MYLGLHQTGRTSLGLKHACCPLQARMEATASRLLRKLRDDLRNELGKLEERRRELEEAMGGKADDNRDHHHDLDSVGMEVKATQRMLALVEATEQQLAAQAKADSHESGPTHLPEQISTEVRARGRGASVETAVRL
jgi:peptidoglycan hydrolase CwlO-like protein